MKVVVSDLTYVNVGGKWNYICLMLDLYNREIVGYAASKNKNAKLVEKALYSIKYDLRKIDLFHSLNYTEFGIIQIAEMSSKPGSLKKNWKHLVSKDY